MPKPSRSVQRERSRARRNHDQQPGTRRDDDRGGDGRAVDTVQIMDGIPVRVMHDDDRSAVDRLLDGRAELAGCLLIRSRLRFPGRNELERGSGVLGPDHVDDRVDQGQVGECLREVA